MKRTVEPEWLDELPENDPRAVRSRLDLRRVNFFMGNVGTIAGKMGQLFPCESPGQIVELGCGDGTFALKLARQFSKRWKNIELVLVDRQNLVSAETRMQFLQLDWQAAFVSADVFDFLSIREPVDCIFTNLFLHHFDPEKLSELLALAAEKSKKFVACEPRRSAMGIAGTKLLGLIGCNAVTRHDATVSVRAGFREQEIAKLWPQTGEWKIEEGEIGLFSHVFVATRV